MKKRNLLVALVMSLAMLLSACGGNDGDKLVGKWVGTLDLTDYIVQQMVAEDASLEKYAKFENLSFNLVFEFTKDTVSLSVDEASAQQFIANAQTGVTNMIDAMVADMATEENCTAEDVFAGMNVTRDAFIEATINSMALETMVSEMSSALALEGTYDASNGTITVIYEDSTFEEMKYTFEKDDLLITVSDGINEFEIRCQKAK